MPFSRFAKMPQEKRDQLLLCAAQEFAIKGFEAASLNHILEVAHIGKSSAYYYFEDKADLFCTVVMSCLDQLQLAPDPSFVASLTAATFWDGLGAIHDQPLQHVLSAPWLFGAVRAAERLAPESLQHPSLSKLTQYLTDYLMTHMGEAIKRGQELGVMRTDLPIELLIAVFRAIDSACDDWLLAHIAAMDQAAISHFSRQTMGTIQQALAPLTTTSH